MADISHLVNVAPLKALEKSDCRGWLCPTYDVLSLLIPNFKKADCPNYKSMLRITDRGIRPVYFCAYILRRWEERTYGR